jgi:hypothetical protein
MMILKSSVLVASLLILPALALADQPATAPAPDVSPATQPATAISFAAVDQTTPKGALKVLLTAITLGDGETLKHVVHAPNDLEASLVTAMGDQKSADRKLTDALYARFPAESPDPKVYRAKIMADTFTGIDAGVETINGDTATVTVRSSKNPPQMRKVDGQWMVEFASLAKGLTDDAIPQHIKTIQVESAIMNKGADDVAAGKYAKLADALQDIAAQLSKATAAAASQPTTQP